MAYLTNITAAYVRQVLDYDPGTGELRWCERPVEHFRDGAHTADHNCAKWNARYAGKVAGTFDTQGYRQIRSGGRFYLAHRLAWLFVTGSWPPHEIDHVDCDKNDNRFDNLRLATGSQNQRNRGVPANNTSGVKGVGFHHGNRKWRATITNNGKQIHLGLFDTIEEAAAAYAAAVKKYHGEFGRVS